MLAVTVVLHWIDFLIIFLMICLGIYIMRRVP